MKHQVIFHSKDKSKMRIKCRLLQFVFGTFKVKDRGAKGQKELCHCLAVGCIS